MRWSRARSDDFPSLVPKLGDPKVAGIIIGSPVYFGNMSSLCKAFLERLMMFRKDNFALSNKVAGVLAVGGARNGGQELTIRSIQTALFGQEMIIVGESRAHGPFRPRRLEQTRNSRTSPTTRSAWPPWPTWAAAWPRSPWPWRSK